MALPSDSLLASVPAEHVQPVAVGARALERYMPGDERWMFVGRYATGHWARQAGVSLRGQRSTFKDLDIANRDFGALRPPTFQNGVAFMDRQSPKPDDTRPGGVRPHYAGILVGPGINVHIFGTNPYEPDPVSPVKLGKWDIQVPIRSAPSQMVMSTWWLGRRLTENFGFGPHAPYLAQVEAFVKMVETGFISETEVSKLWHRCFPGIKKGIFDTIDWAREQVRVQPKARQSVLGHNVRMLLGLGESRRRRHPDYPLISRLQAYQHMRKARARGFTGSSFQS